MARALDCNIFWVCGLEEKYPVHESVEVLEGKTIYKTQKWWLAVLKVKSFGRQRISVYLWIRRGDLWKRQNKLTISDRETWGKIKKAVDSLI